jgi:CRP-like cAMP-binding protein
MRRGRTERAAPLDLERESLDAVAMTTDNLVAPLLRLPIFAGLKPLQLSEIVRNAERLRFWPGDQLTEAGEPADGAYLIVSGPAERVAGPGLPIAVAPGSEALAPGSLIGELAMLVEIDYGSTVVARDRVFCLKLTRPAMHDQMLEDASLAEHFRQKLTERLLQTAADLRRIDQSLVQVRAAQQSPSRRFVAASWGRH